VKIFLKPYLKKKRSFNRSTSSTSTCSGSSGGRCKRFQYITALDEVYEEVEIMKKLDHSNIIKIYEVIDDPNSDKLYLVMPVADYGECINWNHEVQAF